MLLLLVLFLKLPVSMDAEFDCTAYGLKAGTHPEETSQAPEATKTGEVTVSTATIGMSVRLSVYHTLTL